MKNSPSVSQLGSIVAHFIGRYHVIIFSLTVVIGVSAAVLLLNGLIELSSGTDHPVSTTQAFDRETIEKIDNLTPANQTQGSSLSLPSGRINPFVE